MKNIYIIRHGQSEANVKTRGLLSDEGKYVAESNFNLTEVGKEQARETGNLLSKKISGQKYNMYVSPYMRTRQTAEILKEELYKEGIISDKLIEDPRLIEQDYGDFDFQHFPVWPEISPHSYKINQAKFHDPTARFFASFENGENLLDVYNRVSLFATTRLERDMMRYDTKDYIIVTHGNAMRVLWMFLFDSTIETFNYMKVPRNAGGYHIIFDEEKGKYLFEGEI